MKLTIFLFNTAFIIFILGGCSSPEKEKEPDRKTPAKKRYGVTIPFKEKGKFQVSIKKEKEIMGIVRVLGSRVYKKALEKEMQVYPEDSLNTAYTLDELKNRASIIEDTSLFGENDQVNTRLAKFTHWGENLACLLNWNLNKGRPYGPVNVMAIAPVYQPRVSRIMLKAQPFFWIPYAGVTEMLSKRKEKKLYDYLLGILLEKVQEPYSDHAGEKDPATYLSLRDLNFEPGKKGLKGTVNEILHKTQLKIYRAALKGKFKIYRNDSLNSTFTPEELKKRGSKEEVVKIFPDPNRPEYHYDSVVTTYYDPKKTHTFWVLETWEKQKDGLTRPQLKALSPVFVREVEGVKLNPASIFWVKWEELKKTLPEHDINWLEKYLFLTLQEKISSTEK